VTASTGAADTNDDGALDSSHAVRALGALFRGVMLPAPNRGCSGDPTKDTFEPCNYPASEHARGAYRAESEAIHAGGRRALRAWWSFPRPPMGS
jgi:hypothetical protein